uniref:Uncharacterized protein LOC111102406 n=1 Tax=Crassostrea virginica TaxID=6565 RepID=A0A8B8AH42_CRAVI|nr:uncharacterized protein LOC111102406 [Crassostrea virginica]
MARVDVCPQNLNKVIEASEKLGCGDDEYGNNQYLCLPHVNKTSLVEFCYEGIMGRQEKASEGKLIHTNCVGFSSGCPETPYITSDFYKYSACQELNLDHHCYKFDPHCPPKNDVETNDTSTTISILVVYLGLAIVFIALFCILFFCRQKLRQLWHGLSDSLSQDVENEKIPLDPKKTGMITFDEDSQENSGVSHEKAISNKGNSFNEEETTENIQSKQTEKETMELHDKSSEGDTLTERQGQSFNEEDTTENIQSKQTEKETMELHDKSLEGDTLTERQGQSFNEEETTENIQSKQTEKETMELHDKSSEGDTLTERQGQSFNEEETTENIQSKQTEKETMELHDKSSEGDTLTERQGQTSNEENTTENIQSKQTEKETMELHDKSSEGDTLTERQGQHLESDELAESPKLTKTREEKECSLDTLRDNTLKEMKKLLKEGKAFATLNRAVLSITYRIDADRGMDDVYKNIQDVLQIGTIISQNLKSSIAEVKDTCSFLSIVLQKDQSLLKNIKKLDNDKNYSELHHEWKSATKLEERLVHINTYLAQITEGTSKDVVDTLQNLISENEIVKFLEDLQSSAKTLIRESKIKSSAVLATQLINLYSKITILHSYVLWQMFCIKHRYGNDMSTTKDVFEMIDWCCKSNLDMLTCLTHPEVEHAVFLGVFHISENENVDRLLQIQDIEVPAVRGRVNNKEMQIQWSYSPDVALQMKHFSYGIWGTTETTTKKCKFIFEPVEGREMDDIFYIRSARSGWTDSYIQMKSSGTCQTVTNKLDVGVKWKLVSLMSDPKNPNFIITSLDWPGRFLYLDSPTGNIRGKRGLQKVKEKGLWKIRDC